MLHNKYINFKLTKYTAITGLYYNVFSTSPGNEILILTYHITANLESGIIKFKFLFPTTTTTKIKPRKCIHTSWMSALCLRTFLLFITLTMAACKYNFLSSSTADSVCSTSWGLSRCSAAVIRNFVRLLLYSKFNVNTVSEVCDWNNKRRNHFNWGTSAI